MLNIINNKLSYKDKSKVIFRSPKHGNELGPTTHYPPANKE